MLKIREMSSSERQWGERKPQRSNKIPWWFLTTYEEGERKGDAAAKINSMRRSNKRIKPKLTKLKLVTTSKNSKSLGSTSKRKSNSKKYIVKSSSFSSFKKNSSWLKKGTHMKVNKCCKNNQAWSKDSVTMRQSLGNKNWRGSSSKSENSSSRYDLINRGSNVLRQLCLRRSRVRPRSAKKWRLLRFY